MRRCFSILLPACSLLLVASARAAGWEETIPPYAPGNFPEMRPFRAEYDFGWSGAAVASAQIHFSKTDDQFVFDGTGKTAALARRLWQFDVRHTGTIDAHTLRPLKVREVEKRRSKQFDTEVTFAADRVASRRVEEKAGKTKVTEKAFASANPMSLSSAVLYLRSHPLGEGAVERIIVYPARTPYLSTVSVLGRERITVPAGAFDAIKLEVKLDRIGDNHTLEPHKKFKRATVWLSNDNDRIILRIESQVFIGTVFVELQSVQFENPKP